MKTPMNIAGAFRSSTLLLAFLSLISPASALLTRDLSNAVLDHTYILDSDGADLDPTTNRHTAETTFEANFSVSSPDFSHSGNYRVAYKMEDSSSVPIDLVNGDPTHPTEPNKWAYTDPQAVSISIFIGSSSQTLFFDAVPDPVITLDSKTEYRVRGVLQVEGLPGVWSDVITVIFPEVALTPPTQFLHFTNTTSGDPEYNARAGISNLVWEKTHALATDPANDSFEATVDVFVNRWDDYDASPFFNNIAFTADFDLFEQGTNTAIPLENDGEVDFNSGQFNHSFGVPPNPTLRTFYNINASLKPLVQLDSASKTYYLRCTISHIETATLDVHIDTSCDLPPQQLLHFNGNLNFGSFATTFDQISNTPGILAGSTAAAVKTTLNIPADQGNIPNRPVYAYGNNAPLFVDLLDNGNAVLTAGSQQVYLESNPATRVHCDYGGVTLDYSAVTLSTTGANATNLRVLFPQGLNVVTDTLTNPYLGENNLVQGGLSPLDDDLCPTSHPSFAFGPNAKITDESHPMGFTVTNLVVNQGSLDFSCGDVDYIHDVALAHLENLRTSGTITSYQSRRRANDQYLQSVVLADTVATVIPGPDGTSRLSATVETKPKVFRPHFPFNSQVDILSGTPLQIDQGHPNPGQPLEQIDTVQLAYYQTCPEDDCTSGIPPVTVTQKPDNQELFPVPGGGLHAQGALTASTELIWGLRDPGQYAHRTDPFQNTSFYMPGYQLYAEENVLVPAGPVSPGDADDAPQALLLSGFNRDPGSPNLHLSTESEYTDGDGDLPGFNFDVVNGAFAGASRLGGDPNDYGYELLPNASKYYIRLAGVSGRQIATDGTFDPSLILHGFPTELKQFQLSFLDSDNTVPGTTSWVDGNIKTVGPYSEWSQTFTGLRFDCLGEPGDMDADLSDADEKSLNYWNSSFDLKFLKFIKEETNPGACPKKFTAKLLAGAKTRVAHIDQPLFGALAFCPDGNLSTEANKIAEYNSQLGIPANIPLDGPNKDYNLVPVSKLRFNNPTSSGAPGTGFVTFAATLDIPYFVDLQVQAITSATPSNVANFYLTPGWTEGGKTFFDQVDFDPTHRGFPSAGITFSEFRQPDENTSETFLIAAEQKLFNVIDLRYPLKWDITSRRFSSMKSQKQELFVTQVEHQIEWMDAKFANISFGAKYDGLPQLKLSNYLNEQIDNAADVIATEFNAFAKKAVDTAIAQMDKMLEDSLEAIIDPLVDAAAGDAGNPGPIRLIHAELLNIAAANNDYLVFRSRVEQTLTDPVSILYQSTVLDPILNELRKAGMATNDAQSFIKQLDDALQDIVSGIDAIAQGVEIIGGEVQFNATLPSNAQISTPNFAPGLLFKDGGQRNIIGNVVNALLTQYLEPQLVAVIQPLLDDATSALNDELNALLENLDPTLDQIRSVLIQVREVVVEIQAQVAVAAGVADKIAEIISDAETGGLLADIINPVGEKAWAKFLQLEAALGITAASAVASDIDDLISGLTIDQFVQLLKDELKSAILGSDIVQEMQFMLRQTLYDIQDRITSAVQSVLDQLSGVLKEVVAQTVGKLEEQINPLIGQVSKYMGSGEITGYAEINGDSLRKLRLDAKMQFELPEEMSLHVYLEILSYSSEDNFVESGCIEPGEKAVEVRIGAKDVAIEWISDIRINLEVKMTLKDSVTDSFDFPVPNGVGGTFEMTDGELDFQAFTVLEFGATIAIGIDETYIGAKARATFSSYEVAAGIFFGRTCTLEPLLFVDPDIGDVVTAGTTFTGAYVYGEVWLPISELVLGVPASCLFRIDAGVGAGAFYFVEGATYGGKIFLGVSGEALCLVSIRGEVKMIVASQAGNVRGSGTGKFSAKVGWCPFCIKFSKSVKIKFDNGSWSID
ncbi:MAG: hypothetical protein ACON5N_11860 [Akkermansiaceae bacterium]